MRSLSSARICDVVGSLIPDAGLVLVLAAANNVSDEVQEKRTLADMLVSIILRLLGVRHGVCAFYTMGNGPSGVNS